MDQATPKKHPKSQKNRPHRTYADYVAVASEKNLVDDDKKHYAF